MFMSVSLKVTDRNNICPLTDSIKNHFIIYVIIMICTDSSEDITPF